MSEKMLKREFHHDFNGIACALEAKQQHQLPDHLKCGEVYTWLCAGELYAVECKLCEDHPLCPLSEFPEHMDIWHTNWEAANQKYEENNINLQSSVYGEENHDDANNDDDILVSFCNNDGSSLIEPRNQLQKQNVKIHQEPDVKNCEEMLEPFEQVLIESTQISQHVNEEEYFKDVNEQVADAEQCQTKNKHKQTQKLHFNANQTLQPTADKQRLDAKQVTENERDLQYVKEIQQSDKEFNVNNRNMLQSNTNCLKFNIKHENNEKKGRNGKQKLKNIREINNKNLQETSGSETSDEEYMETKKILRKSSRKTKNIRQNLTKIREIKQTLKTIVKAINELNEFEETESETHDSENSNENQDIVELRTKSAESVKNSLEHNLRNKWNQVERTFKAKFGENETETSETEKDTSDNKICKLKKQIKKTEGLNKSNIKFIEEFSKIQENTEMTKNEAIESKMRGNLRDYKSETSKNGTTKTELVNREDYTESKTSENKQKSNKIQIETAGLATITNENYRETNKYGTNAAKENIENSLNKKENILIKFKKCKKSKRIAKEDLITPGEAEKNKTEIEKNKARDKKQPETKTAVQTTIEINKDIKKIEKSGKTVLSNRRRKRSEHETKLTLNDKIPGENQTNLNETREIEIERSESEVELSNNKIKIIGNETEQSQVEVELSDNQIYLQEESVKQSKNETILNENKTKLMKFKPGLDKNESQPTQVKTNETMEKIKAELNLNEMETEMFLNEKETNEKQTMDARFIECVLTSFETRKKAEKLIRKHRKNLKEDKKLSKNLSDVNLFDIKVKRNKNKLNKNKNKINLSKGEHNEIETELSENKTATNQHEEINKAESIANEIETLLLKNKSGTFEIERGINENKKIDDKFIECVLNSFDSIKKANSLIRKEMKSRKKLKENKNNLKNCPEHNGSETEIKENETKYSKAKTTEEQNEFKQKECENKTKTNQNAEKNKVELRTNESGTSFYKNNAENETLLKETRTEISKYKKELNDNETYDNFYLKSIKIRKEDEIKLKGKRKKSKKFKKIKNDLKLLNEGNETEPVRNKTELEKIKTTENRAEHNEIEVVLNEKETKEGNNIEFHTKEIATPMKSNKSEINMENENRTHSSGIGIEASELETLNKELGTIVDHSFNSYNKLRRNFEIETEQYENGTQKSKAKLSENEKQHKEYITKITENEKLPIDIVEGPNENKTGTNEIIKINKAQLSPRERTNSLHKNKSTLILNENQTKMCQSDKETSGNETFDAKFFECLLESYNLRKKADKILKRKRIFRTEQSGSETKIAENKISSSKINFKDDEGLIFPKSLENSPLHSKKTRQSLGNLNKNDERFQNLRSFNGSQKEFSKNEIEIGEEQQCETEQHQELSERDDDVMDYLEKCASLELKEKIKSSRSKRKTIKRELSEEKQKETQFFESSYKKRLRNHKSPSKPVQQVHLNNPVRQRNTDEQDAFKSETFSVGDSLNPVKRAQRKSSCKTNEDETFTSNSLAESSTEFSESSECVQELSQSVSPTNEQRSKEIEKDKGESSSWKNYETRMRRCVTETTSRIEKRETPKNYKELEDIADNTLTYSDLVSPKHFEMQDIADETSSSLNSISPKTLEMRKSSSDNDTEPLSPLSPKTEEEHFEFNEPQKEKLNKQHISHLIKLYQEHPHLWDQSHPDFCEPQVCRKSWQQITEQWNQFCQRQFTTAEVRIRICTLCQRFVQERERLTLEGELDELAKFPYYEQMQFLEQQKTLQKRRELYEQQNEQILEIYENFPILWHVGCYKLRQPKARAQAFDSIHNALKVCGINLSIFDVHKRIRSLRKCYRLEKIRFLHARVEQTSYAAEFRHFERMQFLDKHIDPFVCRICDKIFENLQRYREHLEFENHGSILPEESDAEMDIDIGTAKNGDSSSRTSQDFNKNIIANLNKKQLVDETLSPISNHIDSFTESENSRDILQRFTPLSCSPNPSNISISNLELVISDNASSSPYIQQDLNFPLNTPHDPVINSLHLEDQLIEEIMENVTKNDSLSQPGLDQFINTVTNCVRKSTDNSLSQEICDSDLLHTQTSFVIEHPATVSDQILCDVSPKSNMEIEPNGFSYVVEHPDVVTDGNIGFLDPATNVENFVSGSGNSFALEHLDPTETIEYTPPTSACEEKSSIKELRMDHFEQGNMAKSSPPEPLVMTVHSTDYTIDQNLNPETFEENPSPSLYDSDKEFYSSADITTIPLPDHLIHKMIEFYRKYPQLWNPNHLDFNSRTLRRQAWCSLTTEFNSAVGKQLSWRTLHRKLTDYAKYYKKLITEQENYEQLENKWVFYEDFRFMDDVIAVQTELQRSVHHRDNNFKIIAIYKTFPQLWDIKHPDYNKRSTKQRNIELMCNRLQEENNLQLTTERLKNRLIELRAQYRVAKKQRLKCLKNQQDFHSNDFEFYEALRFLDDHIDPFVCDQCKMEFKKLTAYNQHLKKEHSSKVPHKKLSLAVLPYEPGVENICHICAIKFTTRSNLLHHIRRHEGIRDYECTLCPKTFYASYALKVHIRSHTKECPYTCEKCGLSFVSASKLNQHFKRHLNRKDYKCDYCPKAFFTAYERDRHTKRHLNIRDKVCPICGKTFVAGSSYYAHLMLHSDTKRFQCDKCDMKFTQYPGLYKHKKRHHT